MPCKRLSLEELMQQAMWTKADIARVFRRDPRTLDKYINNPNPKERLKGYLINGQWMAERRVIMRYFEFEPFKNEREVN
ncbi:MAG: hypothetical protein GY839_19355 [candidate division Zixibacteria bacterium]|nr:hypothetical protein [candidate division Zixibacteria bacterium]